jgi:hypothetical protein
VNSNFQAPKDDVYGLLYTLSEMINGRLPWSGDGDGKKIAEQKQSTPIVTLFP